MEKQFYHELTMEERNALKGNITLGQLKKRYKKPEWCAYPKAIMNMIGCWSLMGDMVFREADCYRCDLHLKDGKIDYPKYSIWEAPYDQRYIYTGMLWVRHVDVNTADENACYYNDKTELSRRLWDYIKKHPKKNRRNFLGRS